MQSVSQWHLSAASVAWPPGQLPSHAGAVGPFCEGRALREALAGKLSHRPLWSTEHQPGGGEWTGGSPGTRKKGLCVGFGEDSGAVRLPGPWALPCEGPGALP